MRKETQCGPTPDPRGQAGDSRVIPLPTPTCTGSDPRVIPPLSAVPQTPELSARLAALVDDAVPERTRIAYASDWRRWEAWCAKHGARSLPAQPLEVAEYVARYGADIEDGRTRPHAASTLERWVAGIDAMHRRHHLPTVGADDLVRKALSGARHRQARNREAPGVRRARPLELHDLRLMLPAIATMQYPGGVAAIRDTALLLCGFAAGRRRSEIAAANLGDLTWHAHDGYHWRIPVSKTDQDGTGLTTVLWRGQHTLTCPPCALTRWLQLRAVLAAAAAAPPGHEESLLSAASRSRLLGRRQRVAAMWFLHQQRTAKADVHVCRTPPGWQPTRGGPPVDITLEDLPLGLHGGDPLFVTVHRGGRLGDRISGEVVTDVLLRARRAANLPTAGYSAHSLRAGFVTAADRGGATVMEIQQQTGHRTHESVAVYRRRYSPADGNAVTKIGL